MCIMTSKCVSSLFILINMCLEPFISEDLHLYVESNPCMTQMLYQLNIHVMNYICTYNHGQWLICILHCYHNICYAAMCHHHISSVLSLHQLPGTLVLALWRHISGKSGQHKGKHVYIIRRRCYIFLHHQLLWVIVRCAQVINHSAWQRQSSDQVSTHQLQDYKPVKIMCNFISVIY